MRHRNLTILDTLNLRFTPIILQEVQTQFAIPILSYASDSWVPASLEALHTGLNIQHWQHEH